MDNNSNNDNKEQKPTYDVPEVKYHIHDKDRKWGDNNG